MALKPGEKLEAEVEGLDAKVLLLNAGGNVQAVGSHCTHYGAPLVKGVVGANGTITCPWHGGKILSTFKSFETIRALPAPVNCAQISDKLGHT